VGQARLRIESFVDFWKKAIGRASRRATRSLLQITFASFIAIGAMPAFAQELSSAAKDLNFIIRELQDNKGLPYVVVDKLEARVFVFDGRGALVASTAALLGLARGDHSVPGIGQRPLAQIRPGERTTPAGRFFAEPGRNATGEHVVWIDYDAALSLHRLRDGRDKRLNQRLLSATPLDNRTSYGCVTVPVAFYESVIKPVFAASRGVVYILPETIPWRQAFDFDG
jgi:hypothetical protein